jgi:hypothetical protein
LPRTLAAAARDIHDPKLQVQRSVIPDLARLAHTQERERAIALLLEVLASKANDEVRADTAVALADVGATQACSLLMDAARERHPRLRQMAILALGELAEARDPAAQRVIYEALASDLPALRFQALLAAARLEIDDLAPQLERALGDRDPALRYLALRLVEERWDSLQERSSLIAQARTALGDAELNVRVAAALLPFTPLPDAVERILIDAVNSRLVLDAPEDQQALLERVADLKLLQALPGLRSLAWGLFGLSGSPFAWQARVALLQLGDARALGFFRRELSSRQRDRCTHAVVAVGRAGALALRPALKEVQRSGRVEQEVVREALAALGPDG